MATATTPPRASAAPDARPGGPSRGSGDVAVGLLPLLAVAGGTSWLLALPASYLLVAVGVYALAVALILAGRPEVLPGDGLGAANRVTLARATLVMPVAALAVEPAAVLASPAAGWWVVAVGTLAMALDGVDGRVARRTGGASAFGARFDMELDAFLLLALSALLWRSGRAGPWVLLVGALRYLFVAAGWAWPALTRPLPPRFRRKVVCVVQGVALLTCLGPVVPGWAVPPLAGTALALLAWSFAVDVAWLASGSVPAAAPASMAPPPRPALPPARS